MFTFLWLYGDNKAWISPRETYAECYQYAKLHNKRGIQWAIRRNSDNVIVAMSKNYKERE